MRSEEHRIPEDPLLHHSRPLPWVGVRAADLEPPFCWPLCVRLGARHGDGVRKDGGGRRAK